MRWSYALVWPNNDHDLRRGDRGLSAPNRYAANRGDPVGGARARTIRRAGIVPVECVPTPPAMWSSAG